jgi:ribosomal protein S12 methylthiotransferase accessory factor
MIYLAEQSESVSPLLEILSARLGAKRATRDTITAKATAGDDLVIVATVNATREVIAWQRLAVRAGIRVTLLTILEDELLIGPDVQADVSGCAACLHTRYFGGRSAARRYAEICGDHEDMEQAPSLSSPLKEIAALLLTHWISHGRQRDAAKEKRLLSFSMIDFTSREVGLIPDPNCPECALLPMDTPARAQLEFVARPKKYPAADRNRSIHSLQYVTSWYADGRTKVVPSQGVRWPVRRGAVVTVGVPLSRERPPEPCSGFSPCYSDATTTAVLEGLERYAGVRPRGYQPAICKSRAQLDGWTPDPRSFGLHSPESYARNPHLLTPYSEDLRLTYVWAYSFSRQGPILLPQQLGYYSLATDRDPIFVIEGSLGCALGSCIEECVLHGIFEIAERDAFLHTWYARISPPRLDPMESDDPEIRYYIRSLNADGFDVFAFDITNDLQIPAIWLTARRRDNGMPNSVSLSAAHIKPERALKKAFRELVGVLCRYEIEVKSATIQQRIKALANDASSVRTMMDHALFYCSPASTGLLDFLLPSSSHSSLEQMACRASCLLTNDITEDLKRIVDSIRGLGLDIFAVNQTPPEQLAKGLHTVKTLIPGTIPMSWGEHLRRTSFIPRLDRAVVNGINPAPHPFP